MSDAHTLDLPPAAPDPGVPLDQRLTYTIAETQQILGVGESTVRKHIPTILLGGRRLVRRSDLVTYIDSLPAA